MWPEPSDRGEFGILVFPAHCPFAIMLSPQGPEGPFECPGPGMLLLLFAAGNLKLCLHRACTTTATNLVKLKPGNIRAGDSFLLNLRYLSQSTEV